MKFRNFPLTALRDRHLGHDHELDTNLGHISHPVHIHRDVAGVMHIHATSCLVFVLIVTMLGAGDDSAPGPVCGQTPVIAIIDIRKYSWLHPQTHSGAVCVLRSEVTSYSGS